MAKLATLLDVYTDARRLADQETTLLRFPRDEVVSYVNMGLAEWWDVVVSSLGAAYCGLDVTGTLLSGTSNIPIVSLASRFYKFDRLHLRTNATDRTAVTQLRPEEEHRWLNKQAARPERYSLDSDTIWFYPASDRGYLFQFRYVPVAPVLVEDTDEFDTINAWGDTYAATYAARRMALKDGEVAEAQSFLADLAGLTKRIQALAPTRDVSSPIRVADVREPSSRRRRTRWIP